MVRRLFSQRRKTVGYLLDVILSQHRYCSPSSDCPPEPRKNLKTDNRVGSLFSIGQRECARIEQRHAEQSLKCPAKRALAHKRDGRLSLDKRIEQLPHRIESHMELYPLTSRVEIEIREAGT